MGQCMVSVQSVQPVWGHCGVCAHGYAHVYTHCYTQAHIAARQKWSELHSGKSGTSNKRGKLRSVLHWAGLLGEISGHTEMRPQLKHLTSPRADPL